MIKKIKLLFTLLFKNKTYPFQKQLAESKAETNDTVFFSSHDKRKMMSLSTQMRRTQRPSYSQLVMLFTHQVLFSIKEGDHDAFLVKLDEFITLLIEWRLKQDK